MMTITIQINTFKPHKDRHIKIKTLTTKTIINKSTIMITMNPKNMFKHKMKPKIKLHPLQRMEMMYRLVWVPKIYSKKWSKLSKILIK